jgi:glycosyltransferase involved in cell wall biosynthesis
MGDGAERLSILMTTDCVGGVFTYTVTLASELSARGATIALAVMGPEPMRAAQRAQLRAIPGLTVHESSFALEWMDDAWEDVARAGDWLVQLEREVEPDIVHLGGYCHGDAGFRAPRMIVGHSCVLSWWEAVVGEAAPSRYDEYRRAVRRGLAAADAIVAPSRAMMRALDRHYLLPAGGGARAERRTERAERRVVYNGAPPLPPRPLAKEPFVLSAGRLWDRAKNIETLAHVAGELPWPVRVAGSDVHPDGARRPLPGVEHLGWLDPTRLGAMMDRAAIFALPARYEPFGLCPLEAAQRGCALVLGDIESLREIWADAAIFVAPDDDAALARAITDLAHDGGARVELGRRARARAGAFTSQRMADETLAAYAEILRTDVSTLGGEPLPCA